MEVIPVINCPDAECAREKITAAGTFLPEGSFLHLDVTDGAFTFHKAWNRPTEWANLRAPYKLEVHLMVERPEREIDAWLAAGAARFIVHVETIHERSVKEILAKCARRGAGVMLSSRPETSVKKMEPYLPRFTAFQVLSVHPGPAAQKFLPLTLKKVEWLRRKALDVII